MNKVWSSSQHLLNRYTDGKGTIRCCTGELASGWPSDWRHYIQCCSFGFSSGAMELFMIQKHSCISMWMYEYQLQLVVEEDDLLGADLFHMLIIIFLQNYLFWANFLTIFGSEGLSWVFYMLILFSSSATTKMFSLFKPFASGSDHHVLLFVNPSILTYYSIAAHVFSSLSFLERSLQHESSKYIKKSKQELLWVRNRLIINRSLWDQCWDVCNLHHALYVSPHISMTVALKFLFHDVYVQVSWRLIVTDYWT